MQERRAADQSIQQLKAEDAALDEREARLHDERSALEEERAETLRAHESAVEQHEQARDEFENYQAALARAEALSGECAELDLVGLEVVLGDHDYLADLSANPERDKAIRHLEACRAKTASRLRALERAGPSDAKIKKAIVRESIASTPGNCPCPYHRASNGSRCGGRSSYSRYGGNVVQCYPRDVSKEQVANYRASLHTSPLLAYRDQFRHPWTTRPGETSPPAPVGPAPVTSPEVRSRVAELDGQIDQVDTELSQLAEDRRSLHTGIAAHLEVVQELDQEERLRQDAWRVKQGKRAGHRKWAGLAMAGIGTVGVLVGLNEARKSSDSQQAQTMAIAFGVGIPLAVLGTALWATSKRSGSRTVSAPNGQLQVRF